ncbi:MAG: ROK family protein [Bacteroidales bacterium]|nr:ROK family protein [Bacteroidales bacterium]
MTFKEENYLIGVDLGGTKISAGLLKGSKIINQNQRFLPGTEATSKEMTQLLIDVVASVFDKNVKGIGIGVPGLLDRNNGVVYEMLNIPAWGNNIPVGSILENCFNVPAYVDNDANCFALGEFRFGNLGSNIKNFVGLTIGTGMGVGIVNNGYLLHDAHCGSGEFGSIPYLDGIMEDYCSGKFFKSHYGMTGEILAEKASSGNQYAINAFREFGKHLGIAVKTILFTLDPSVIIIGGSVAKSHLFFENTMWEHINNFPYKQTINDLILKFNTDGRSPILGAASLYYDRNEIKNYKSE